MRQIIINYLTIFIFPAVLGGLLRFIFRNKTKGYLVTVLLFCISIGLILFALLVPAHGNEAPGLTAVSSVIAAGTCLICGIIIRLNKNKHKV